MAGRPRQAKYAEPIVTDKPHGARLYRSSTPCRCEVCTTAATAMTVAEAKRMVERGAHGTLSGYRVAGCRCDLCREANRLARRNDREARYAERIKVGDRWFHPKVGLRHGTLWAYKDHGCRCDPCAEQAKQANAANNSKAKAKAKLATRV